MAIDPSIALQVRPPQLDDPTAVRAKQLQLRDLMSQGQMRDMQMQQAQRAQADEMTLADLYRTSGGDATKLRAGMAERGLGARIPAFDKQQAELGKSMTERDKAKFELVRSQYDAVDNAMRSLLADPQLTPDKVIGLLSAQAQSYREFPEMIEKLGQEARNLPPDPGRLRQYLMQKLIEGQKGKEQLDALLPKIEYKQTGKQMVPVDTNALTNPNPQALAMTTTPGEDQSAATQRRGQNMTDARSRDANELTREANRIEAEAKASQIVNDPMQGLLIVNKGTKQATPAVFGDGQAVPGETVAKNKANAGDVQALLGQATEKIKKATGSYTGAAVDQLARVFGSAPDGAIAIAELKAIEGALLAKMPRMEGPQSNLDVQNYRQAVGQIGDPTVPNAAKTAAVEVVKQTMSKYAAPVNPAPAAKPAPKAGAVVDGFIFMGGDPSKQENWKAR